MLVLQGWGHSLGPLPLSERASPGDALKRPYNYFLVGQNDLLPDEVDAHADL